MKNCGWQPHDTDESTTARRVDLDSASPPQDEGERDASNQPN